MNQPLELVAGSARKAVLLVDSAWPPEEGVVVSVQGNTRATGDPYGAHNGDMVRFDTGPAGSCSELSS